MVKSLTVCSYWIYSIRQNSPQPGTLWIKNNFCPQRRRNDDRGRYGRREDKDSLETEGQEITGQHGLSLFIMKSKWRAHWSCYIRQKIGLQLCIAFIINTFVNLIFFPINIRLLHSKVPTAQHLLITLSCLHKDNKVLESWILEGLNWKCE